MIFGFLSSRRSEYLEDWIDLLWAYREEIGFTSTGGLLRVAQIEPPDLETADREELVAFHRQLLDVLGLPGTGWSIWCDQWRREDRAYLPESDFGGNEAAAKVDAARRTQFVDSRNVYSNQTSVALHWVPQPRDAMLTFLHDRDPASVKEKLRAFLDQSDEFFRGLAHICPSVRVMRGEALATYLAETITYRHVPTQMPSRHEHLGSQLGKGADWDNSVVTELLVDGMKVAAVDVHVFGALTPLTLEPLHELPFECRWTITAHFLDPEDQRREVGKLRNYWRPKQYGAAGWLAVIVTRSRSSAQSRADIDQIMAELDDLEGSLQEDRDGLAIAAMTVRVWDRDPNVAEDRAQTVVGILNGAGLRSRPATTSTTIGALADIPGNASRRVINPRQPRIRLSTIGRCTPLTGLSTGSRRDEHLGGPALMVLKSRRRLPLFWSLHAPGDDVGHTMVLGPTGGGKSALLSAIALQFERYPDATVTMFDKRYSAMVATLCSDNARWLELGGGGIGVQPLRDIDDAAGFSWATTWLHWALELRQVKVSARVDAALNEGLMALQQRLAPDERTLSAFHAHLGGDDDTRRALWHYTAAAGTLGKLFDGVVASYGDARLLTLEYNEIIRSNFPEGALAFAACFRQIERERLLRGGHPKLLIIDEAWEPLGHPLFQSWLQDMTLTGRKLNLSVVLATQSIRHLESPITAIILEQTRNRIFTAAPSALEDVNAQVYRGIGLSDEQIRAVASLRPKGEYLLKTPMFARVGEMTLDGDALRICGASREADVARARRLLAENVAPGREFLGRWLAS
jgi:type IV secretory pathway VirB4 component